MKPLEIDEQNQTSGIPPEGTVTSKANGEITPPKNVIQSIQTARAFYQLDREDHIKRILLATQIEGMIAGNPPYDPKDLQAHGIAHISNFNTLDARALYERASLAYWNLLYSAERLFKFSVEINDPAIGKIQDILTDNFDKIIKQWPSLRTQINTLIAQVVKFGISPCFWPDERDFRWRVVEYQRFFVPPQASTDMEILNRFEIESVFTAQYLYEIYAEYKDTPIEETPWNCDEIANLLIMKANQNQGSNSMLRDMMDFQQRLESGDISWGSTNFSDGFRIVSQYQREYDNKITVMMFDRDYDAGSFLYYGDRQYNNFEEAIVLFTASPGEFVIHANRGVGHKIFAGCQAMMQMDCSLVDMVKFASTPFIKTLNIGGKEFSTIRVTPGVPTDIGPAEFVQNNFGANTEQLVAASQYMMGKINYNAANSGDDPGMPDRDQGSISPSQARMRSFREFGVLKNNIQHFYSFFDVVGHNMAVKFFHAEQGDPGYEEYYKPFKEKCIEQGVPPELFDTKGVEKCYLPPNISIKATRVAGDGSTLALIMGLESLQLIAPEFTQQERTEYKRQWIRATMGPDYVPVFMNDNSDEVGEGVSLASVENSVMEMGKSAVVSPSNDHQSHIIVHTALANDIIQRIKQQQMTPIDGDKVFEQLIPHNGEHIQIYSQSMFAKPFLDKYIPAWKEITDFAQKNRVLAAKMVEAEIRQRQEDAAKQEEAMTDAQRKDFIAQRDAERADFKVQQQVERAKEANVTRGQVMREKVQTDAEIQREKTQLDAQNQNTKTQTEIANATAKNNANIRGITQKQQLEAMSDTELMTDSKRLQGNRPAQYDFE